MTAVQRYAAAYMTYALSLRVGFLSAHDQVVDGLPYLGRHRRQAHGTP